MSVVAKKDLENFLAAQRLAEKGAQEIAGYLQEGWSEKKAADLLNTWLKDHGVKSFFHGAFAWFGERTRFRGFNRKNYPKFMPSDRVLLEGEVYILDVAPIYNGYTCDIGYSACLGENRAFNDAMTFLKELRNEIPKLFTGSKDGAPIWAAIDQKIGERGYDNIHALYPYSVLGHRVHRSSDEGAKVKFLNFGWQSYWGILSRGLFGQLLNQEHCGDLDGLWAIEPHIGTETFGAKFEEILVVENGQASWLEPTRNF